MVDSSKPVPRKPRFWDRWRITVHSDIGAVFDLAPPDSVVEEISRDDHFTANLIRRQYTRQGTLDGGHLPTLKHFKENQQNHASQQSPPPPQHQQQQQRSERESSDRSASHGGGGGGGAKTPKTISRRDSIMPFPGLRAELRGLLSESGEVNEITSRLEALEESTSRIEELLMRLVGNDDASQQSFSDAERDVVEEAEVERTGTVADLDRTADEAVSDSPPPEEGV